MFKIVQTVERGKKELTIIPEAWEVNNILFWPKNRADKLIKQADSQPEDNWFKLNCKLKRNHLANLEIADEELKRTLEEDHTEQEEREIPNPLPQKRPRVIAKTSVNLNDAAQSCVDNVNITDLPVNTEPSSFIIYENEIPEVIESQLDEQNKLDTIVTTLSTVIENQDKIMHQMAKFEVMFDEAMLKFNKPINHVLAQSKKIMCQLQQSILLRKWKSWTL